MTKDEVFKMAKECRHCENCSNCPYHPARLNRDEDCTSVFAEYILTQSDKLQDIKITREDLQPFIKEFTAFLKAVTSTIVYYLNKRSQGETSEES